jgi:hypothetical protein
LASDDGVSIDTASSTITNVFETEVPIVTRGSKIFVNRNANPASAIDAYFTLIGRRTFDWCSITVSKNVALVVIGAFIEIVTDIVNENGSNANRLSVDVLTTISVTRIWIWARVWIRERDSSIAASWID